MCARNFFRLLFGVFLSVSLLLLSPVSARKPEKQPKKHQTTAAVPGSFAGFAAPEGTMPHTGDEFSLGSWSFNGCSEQGWIKADPTAPNFGIAQDVFFHVAQEGSELDGGSFGTLHALAGTKSMWCGVSSEYSPCVTGYVLATPPGYGNDWDQRLTFVGGDLSSCDSVAISYRIQWDAEQDYDGTTLQILDNGTWENVGAVNSGAGVYDGSGGPLDESFAFGNINGIRFLFASDNTWSDEDGNIPTDGAVLLDNITVTWYDFDGTNWNVSNQFVSDFEGSDECDTADANWSASSAPPAKGFGQFGMVHGDALDDGGCPGYRVCFWGWFDDPDSTNYACGGHSSDGAIRYGPDSQGRYMNNEIWSPPIDLVGAGDQYILRFDIFEELPLDGLVFYYFGVRTRFSGFLYTSWESDNMLYYGNRKFWNTVEIDISPYIEKYAESIQVRLGVIDMYPEWGNVVGTGQCHSQAPLFDRVEVVRINNYGPVFSVQHRNLFQDNFAADGTLVGKVRADAAVDITSGPSSSILPGDSISTWISDVIGDPNTGFGPAAYVFINAASNQVGGMEAQETLSDAYPGANRGSAKRFPYITEVSISSKPWQVFQMDTIFSPGGSVALDRYCFDLNDFYFVPGDSVRYFLGAVGNGAANSYYTRNSKGQGQSMMTSDIDKAATNAMEWSALPSPGRDILYVDHADGRGGPSQLYFDDAFRNLGITDRVDRFDVLDPTGIVGNSLASRVLNYTQLSSYDAIIWCSGDLRSGLIGDGTGMPAKSDDIAQLFQFLDQGANATLLLSGDNIHEELATIGLGPLSTYYDFQLKTGDHKDVVLLPIASIDFLPPFTTVRAIADGGNCTDNEDLGDFDVLEGGDSTLVGATYEASPHGAVLHQTSANSASGIARVIGDGLSFEHIGDDYPLGESDRTSHLKDVLILAGFSIPSNPVGIDNPPLPLVDFLADPSPNPFNPVVSIHYGIKESSHVSLAIFNVSGQMVATLVDEVQVARPGGYSVTWDGTNDSGQPVASGVYFYRLVSRDFIESKKIVLLK